MILSLRRRWLVSSLPVALAALAASACTDSGAPTSPAMRVPAADVAASSPQTLTFASGVPATGGRDNATLVVSVADPYATARLGGETVPFPAYVIAPNAAYGSISGAAWIGPYPNSGLLNNTTHDAQYYLERQIVVPDHATPSTLDLRLLSDNAVTVYLDGVQFGQQPQVDIGSNFQIQSDFVTAIGGGSHTLRFWLRNGVSSSQGGPTGLDFLGTVTYTCDAGFAPSNGSCVDQTPPEIVVTVDGTKTVPGSDWYTSDVTVTFAVTDAQSDVTTTGCETQHVTTDTPGTTFTCTATSAGGSTTESVMIKRDATNPTVGFTGASSIYTVDQTVTIHCSASDATSGLASDTCSDITGPAYSFALGLNTFTATATDNAGNTSSATVSFTVAVTCESMSSLLTRFVADAKWAKKLGVHLRNVCDKVARNSPAKDEQVKNFLRELGSAQADGAVSPANAATLARLVQAL